MNTNSTSSIKDKLIVGVTGGIGCGKTTVTNLFAQHGVDIVDADEVAREVVRPNSKGLKELISHFGQSILNKNNTLNRGALRTLIFADDNAKNTVNTILHPLIREEMLNQLHNTMSQYCILSAPLLLENKLQNLVGQILVIDIPESLQLERTLSRDGGNITTIKSIMRSQVTREQRLAMADDIIDNSRSINNLKPQVNLLHDKYMAMVKK